MKTLLVIILTCTLCLAQKSVKDKSPQQWGISHTLTETVINVAIAHPIKGDACFITLIAAEGEWYITKMVMGHKMPLNSFSMDIPAHFRRCDIHLHIQINRGSKVYFCEVR